jgi:hypothetical protein
MEGVPPTLSSLKRVRRGSKKNRTSPPPPPPPTVLTKRNQKRKGTECPIHPVLRKIKDLTPISVSGNLVLEELHEKNRDFIGYFRLPQ